jgi:hypothetical protein
MRVFMAISRHSDTLTHTRSPSNGNPTSPDISLISIHLALSVVWTADVALNSDHLPISISFLDDQAPPCSAKTYVNFKRTKWGLWTSETESKFANVPLPTNAATGEKVFRKILQDASKHHISAGFRKDFWPGMPREAVDLAEERDRLHDLDPQDPEIPRLNQLISESVKIEAKK